MRARFVSRYLRTGMLLVVFAAAGCSSAAASTPAGDAGARPAPAYHPQPGVLSGSTGVPSGVGGYDFDGPLTSLGRRTAGPVELRSFRQAGPGGSSCDRYTQSCAPDWCTINGSLVTELSTEALATSRSVGIIGLAPGSHLSVLGFGSGRDLVYSGGPTGPVGVAEGAPVQLQSVRVSPDATIVRLTTPDGEDSVAPTDGLATLAVQGPSQSGRLVALDAGGHELASVNLPADGTVDSPACAPLPPQPPTAGTPPVDPAAAEKQIRQAFTTAFTHAPPSDRYRALAAVENGERLKPALDQLGQNFPEVGQTVTVTTGRLVFTTPTTAAVEFTLHYTGGAPYGTKYGKALLIGDQWVVSREAFCGALSYASVTCPV
jgi:hypothetical protein